MSKVILMLIDGLRPDALAAVSCPHLTAFQQRAAWSLTASSVMPSMTLPCHASIFHSVPPARHGIMTNDWQPMARPVLGLVDLAKNHNKRCAFFYNWEPLRDLSRPGSLAFSYFCDNVYSDLQGDQVIARAALAHIQREQPHFAFVYLGTLDTVGHIAGWMSESYLNHLAWLDGVVGELLAGVPAGYTTLIQSDHGGHERTHGTSRPEDMLIPWLAAGPLIKPGPIAGPVSLLNTAPTIAHLLGLPIPLDWEGQPVTEIFANE